MLHWAGNISSYAERNCKVSGECCRFPGETDTQNWDTKNCRGYEKGSWGAGNGTTGDQMKPGRALTDGCRLQQGAAENHIEYTISYFIFTSLPSSLFFKRHAFSLCLLWTWEGRCLSTGLTFCSNEVVPVAVGYIGHNGSSLNNRFVNQNYVWYMVWTTYLFLVYAVTV